MQCYLHYGDIRGNKNLGIQGWLFVSIGISVPRTSHRCRYRQFLPRSTFCTAQDHVGRPTDEELFQHSYSLDARHLSSDENAIVIISSNRADKTTSATVSFSSNEVRSSDPSHQCCRQDLRLPRRALLLPRRRRYRRADCEPNENTCR